MSSLFLVEALDKSVAIVVRARCMTCARQVAVDNAGAEGTEIWRNPAKTQVHAISPSGKSTAILKSVNP